MFVIVFPVMKNGRGVPFFIQWKTTTTIMSFWAGIENRSLETTCMFLRIERNRIELNAPLTIPKKRKTTSTVRSCPGVESNRLLEIGCIGESNRIDESNWVEHTSDNFKKRDTANNTWYLFSLEWKMEGGGPIFHSVQNGIDDKEMLSWNRIESITWKWRFWRIERNCTSCLRIEKNRIELNAPLTISKKYVVETFAIVSP